MRLSSRLRSASGFRFLQSGILGVERTPLARHLGAGPDGSSDLTWVLPTGYCSRIRLLLHSGS